MTIAMECLGSRPHGRRPVVVESRNNEIVFPKQKILVEDLTTAKIIMGKYPGCFKICEQAAIKEVTVAAKQKTNVKDKQLKSEVDKEFF